ncbi:MAG: transcriptional regulator [SAR86 cluster bacterium]|uniref:Transcriptional regulator n=1 Tax=SAR86 cluster bacterium TaxID=2030880 RepID=A0A2A5AWS5_9GAMM|nr:MAG: transcriptional regulator [SAR86 cluster bacterium]
MEFSKSQQAIMQRLKSRGPQSVKILSSQLNMTTMGARQHLTDLKHKGYVLQTQQEKQTRGRPVHLWKLSSKGHGYFPDKHSQITLELIDVIRSTLGNESLENLITVRGEKIQTSYKASLETVQSDLKSQIEHLAMLRSDEGFMAEVRLLPDGWLLIENHCPICLAAEKCQQFCQSELNMFQELLSGKALVSRVDHLLDGDRRCAYKITQT